MGSAKLTNTGYAVALVTSALRQKGLIGTDLVRTFSDGEADEVFAVMEQAIKFARVEVEPRRQESFVEHGASEGTTVTLSDVPTCFATLCRHIGAEVGPHVTSVSQLGTHDRELLQAHKACRIGYTIYSSDDPRNHVIPVTATKSATVEFNIDGGIGVNDCVHGITSAQEFFNVGGRHYKTNFYSSEDHPDVVQEPTPSFAELGFGGDTVPRRQTGSAPRPPPPASVDGSDVPSGGANVTGGVVRPRKRVIKATTTFDKTSAILRNYTVSGTTLFNNVDELFLNTISRSYAQEILEFLFQTWAVPTEQPEAMRYAEDIVFAFLIARTASNKADYNVVYEIPTRAGPVDADFSRLSVLLADHYGITRRNFCRGIADDLRDYLRRPENQPIKSRAAARVGADPQYGHLCFDGSTECSNMTTSEQKFTRVLEAKGLYESDSVLADGASATLMEGIHGGTRSNVAR